MSRQTMLAATVALLLASNAGAQEPVVVSGRVVEAGTGRALRDVAVAVRGGSAHLTDASGAFRLAPIRSGRHILDVSLLGYRAREIALELDRDTTLVIELEVAPLPLEPLDVRARSVQVRGRVTDAVRDIPVRDAEVLLAGDRVTTNAAGRFRVRRVPVGEPAVVVVRAFGFLPAHAEIAPESDTTLAFALEEDPVAARMIDAVVEKLEIRSRGTPYSRRNIGRDDLLRHRNFSVLDLVRQTLGMRLRGVQCVMIDDVQVGFGMEQLDMYPPDELEYVEILDRGGMIRAYTRRYISRRMGPEVSLPPILFIKTPMGPVCR